MARPLRIEFAGALYHVRARGDRREPIYEDEEDRERFLGINRCVSIRRALRGLPWEKVGIAPQELTQRLIFWVRLWRGGGGCAMRTVLMDNHYHLVVETPEGNLSKRMRQLNEVYTQAFNRRHRQVGHLFQGRYKAIGCGSFGTTLKRSGCLL